MDGWVMRVGELTLCEGLLTSTRPLIAGSETVFCKDKAGYDANCESSSLRSKGARVSYYLSTNQTMTEIEDEQFYRDTEKYSLP
jgi:hypothetical protein